MKRKKRKVKVGENVKGHIRHMASGKPVKVRGYKRKVKKSKKIRPMRKKFIVTYYTDPASGRIVGKRKYKAYS